MRNVATGQLNVTVETLRQGLMTLRAGAQTTAFRPLGVLTSREQQILRLFCCGQSYAQIAEVQGNSAPTVRNTIYRHQDKIE